MNMMDANAHDDMAICNMQTNDMATTTNNWKTPGASVSGRYTTLILHPFLNICLFQISNGLPHTDVYVDIF